MKIAAGVEYCGIGFSGWQRQKNALGIQEHVEIALSRVAHAPIQVHCAGRTDSGVHALHQVIHFETEAERAAHSWVMGTNSNMSGKVSLLWTKPVKDTFHARFSAIGRHYRYIILNRTSRASVNHGFVTWECRKLVLEPMREAAVYLVGKHDFTSFRAQGCQAKSPVREIRHLQISHMGDYVIIEVHADAFLQHMVRNIAGVLMEIGMGKQKPDWAKVVLEARSRELGGVTAPATGLYLMDIDYPDEFDLPERNQPGWPLLS